MSFSAIRVRVSPLSPKQKQIIRYARSKGFLSPLWLMPSSEPNLVKKAFQELESFLKEAYSDGEILEVSSQDVSDFMWKLKKDFAFKGWDGIAPLLLSRGKLVPQRHLSPDVDSN